MQLKLPDPLVAPPQLEIVAPEPIVVVTSAPGVNPVPVTVVDAPLGPSAGRRAIAGVVMVNGALALSKLPSEPEAVSRYAVDEALPLIVTEHWNVPVPDTVAPQSVTLAPAPIAAATVTSGVNPLPVSVATIPVGPCPGASTTEGVVMVNVACARSVPASDPVAVIV